MVITYIYSSRIEDQIRVQIRCRNLVDAINRTGLHSANLLDINAFAQNTVEAQKICAASEILVIYRYLYGSILTALQYWKARDKKVIVDFDQAVNYLTADRPEYSFWCDGVPLNDCIGKNMCTIDPSPLEQFKWGLGMVDAATVSSDRLVDDWSQFTDVHMVPDYINIYQYPGLSQFHESEIWIGLRNDAKYESIKNSGLLAAMTDVCRARPQVKLILFGFEKNSDIELNINPGQVNVYFPRFFDEWVNILLKVNIGLSPIYGDYDLRLGVADLLEFMISKIPWIASEKTSLCDMVPYGQWVKNTTDAWRSAILNTVDQLELYQNKAAKASFLFAISQDVSSNIDKVLNLYSTIINRREKV